MAEDRSINSSLAEVEKVQNPAFGALLLWSFGRSYQSNATSSSANMLLYFLVLPICLHKPTLDTTVSTRTRSGLGKFCQKVNREREEMLAVHERCLRLRELTLNSIAFGIRAGLFSLIYGTGQLSALDVNEPAVAERLTSHIKGAVRLGAWFRETEMTQIFKALQVEP